MCKFIPLPILLLQSFVLAASGSCIMPRQIPKDMQGSVSQDVWDNYLRQQQLQIRADGGCLGFKTDIKCTIEMSVEKDFPGVCQNAQGMPVCMESNPVNGSDPRSIMFHSDCMYLLTEEVLRQNLRTNPRPDALLEFIGSLDVGAPSGGIQFAACNITEMVSVSYLGNCFRYEDGYACRSADTEFSVFDHEQCKNLKPV